MKKHGYQQYAPAFHLLCLSCQVCRQRSLSLYFLDLSCTVKVTFSSPCFYQCLRVCSQWFALLSDVFYVRVEVDMCLPVLSVELIWYNGPSGECSDSWRYVAICLPSHNTLSISFMADYLGMFCPLTDLQLFDRMQIVFSQITDLLLFIVPLKMKYCCITFIFSVLYFFAFSKVIRTCCECEFEPLHGSCSFIEQETLLSELSTG